MAMSLAHSVLLGLVQGLTEFLPVSSSGHLVLVQRFIEFRGPALAIDSLLHFGTLMAVLVYFRSEIMLVLRSIGRWLRTRERDDHTTIAAYLVVASVPAAVAGIAFEDLFSHAFNSTAVVGVMLFVTGAILWIIEGWTETNRPLEKMSLSDSVWVGLAQMAAIMPGLSRSGSTIAAGMWRGVAREDAARFSFLLAVPIIAGATVYELLGTSLAGVEPTAAAAGVAAAAFSGFVAIALLMKVIREQKLRLFSVYCFIVGSVAIAVSL